MTWDTTTIDQTMNNIWPSSSLYRPQTIATMKKNQVCVPERTVSKKPRVFKPASPTNAASNCKSAHASGV